MEDEIEIVRTPLAWDRQERPFRPPVQARAWKVRRHTKGRPVIVRDDKGQPVFLPLTASYESFETAVGHTPGLYRLYLVDEAHREIENAPVAYVLIEADDSEPSMGAQIEQQQELISRLISTIERQSTQMAQFAEKLVTAQASLLGSANETIRVASGVQPQSVELDAGALTSQLAETLSADRTEEGGGDGFWKTLFQSPIMPFLMQTLQQAAATAAAAQAAAAQAAAAKAEQAAKPEQKDGE